MPFKFMPIQNNGDMNAMINQINQNFALLDGEAVTKTFNNSQGNKGLVQGKLPDDLGTGTLLYGLDGKALISMRVDEAGNPSLKVAKAGFDANTATNDQLALNSAQNTLKVAMSGSLTIPAAAAGAGYGLNVAHSLGKAPMVLATVKTPNDPATNTNVMPYSFWISATNYLHTQITPASTVVSFNVSLGSGVGAGYLGDYIIRYYFLQETADLT